MDILIMLQDQHVIYVIIHVYSVFKIFIIFAFHVNQELIDNMILLILHACAFLTIMIQDHKIVLSVTILVLTVQKIIINVHPALQIVITGLQYQII